MKKILIVVASVLVSVGTFGQGTINFSNVGPGLNAPISKADGTKLSGDKYKAELLVGSSASSLTAVATSAFSSTASAAGLFLGGSVTLAGQAGGTSPFIQVRAWDTTTGATYAAATTKGASTVFVLGAKLGDPSANPPTTPPALLGMTSFSLVPEPSVIALALLGGAALLMRRRK